MKDRKFSQNTICDVEKKKKYYLNFYMKKYFYSGSTVYTSTL
jgi:hypothetical protein